MTRHLLLLRPRQIHANRGRHALNVTMTQLIHFLQNYQGLTNLAEAISLLQDYQDNFPTLQLKIPLYGAFPSIEI
jgi:hypothetical protein